jgi:hypothetical protein
MSSAQPATPRIKCTVRPNHSERSGVGDRDTLGVDGMVTGFMADLLLLLRIDFSMNNRRVLVHPIRLWGGAWVGKRWRFAGNIKRGMVPLPYKYRSSGGAMEERNDYGSRRLHYWQRIVTV